MLGKIVRGVWRVGEAISSLALTLNGEGYSVGLLGGSDTFYRFNVSTLLSFFASVESFMLDLALDYMLLDSAIVLLIKYACCSAIVCNFILSNSVGVPEK